MKGCLLYGGVCIAPVANLLVSCVPVVSRERLMML